MGKLGKYSFGTGDRFGKEGKAQLEAILKMHEEGTDITPVWNKSNREHKIVGTKPVSTRKEADLTSKKLDYKGSYFVDADHINLNNVDPYIPVSDFFTIDVAEFIGKEAKKEDEQAFLKFFEKYSGELQIPGIDRSIEISNKQLDNMLHNFLLAMKKAGEVYKKIASSKSGNFYTEVSIDEVKIPQSPVELFFILAALSFHNVPVNTIAPKFTGEFNKGIDYNGDLKQFEQEFEEDLLVLKFAITEFGLPSDLKLSVHSGSDKFSLYPIINNLIHKHNSGLHLKTAGTTWLEELIGLAESEGEAYVFAKEIYTAALERYEEITKDYVTVLDINRSKLPEVKNFSLGKDFANALRHDPNSEHYNPHFRQLLHCAYKIAAEREDEFFDLLEKYRAKIEENVSYNLYERHLKPLFLK